MSPKYSSTLDGGGWWAPRPGSFTTGKVTRYPLYRRLDGLHSWSGRVRIISPPPGFDPRNARPVASHYTDWAIPAHNNIWCRVQVMKLLIRRLSASCYFLHSVIFCIPLLSASHYFMRLNIFDSAVFLPLVWETKFHILESTEIYPQLSGLTLHCAEARRSCLHHGHCAKTSSTSTS
jgi:hypothetical protein